MGKPDEKKQAQAEQVKHDAAAKVVAEQQAAHEREIQAKLVAREEELKANQQELVDLRAGVRDHADTLGVVIENLSNVDDEVFIISTEMNKLETGGSVLNEQDQASLTALGDAVQKIPSHLASVKAAMEKAKAQALAIADPADPAMPTTEQKAEEAKKAEDKKPDAEKPKVAKRDVPAMHYHNQRMER